MRNKIKSLSCKLSTIPISAKSRGQVWGLDIMVGATLFLAGIMIFFIYSINQPSQAYENLNLLMYDGEIIVSNLISEGYPKNWDENNVISIGLTNNNKINQTKLETLYQMIYTQNNYTKTKNILNTKYDYYFFLEDNMTVSAGTIEGIGKPGITKDNIIAKDLTKTTRFTIYQNKTTPIYLYIWQE